MQLIVFTLLYFATSSFGDDLQADSCRGETFSTGVGLRQYSTWANTPYDPDNWKPIEYTCNRTSMSINGQYFSRPTRCVHYGPGPDVRAEFDVNDKSCSVDHSWLFEKIGKVIGKDFRCSPRSNSDGCTTFLRYMKADKIGKDYLHAACVVHDICYAAPASFGITKDKCDKLALDLGKYRCEEVNDPECYARAIDWFNLHIDAANNYPVPDFLQSTYDDAQKAKTPCSLTVKQRQSALYQGRQMDVGATRWSPNGRFVLIMQCDGNLVIYRKPSNKAIWSSKTGGSGAVKAVMQNDGNFVLYTADNTPRWHTGTDIKPTNHLLLQDDGNLVIYSMGAPTSMWASKAHPGYLIPMSTNLRTESFNSTSNEDIGTMTMQEDLPDPPVDIVHFDRDPNSDDDGPPDEALKHALDGSN